MEREEDSKDDSLADFKSPKAEPLRLNNKPTILNDRRTKKTAKTKRRKPEVTRRNASDDRIQPTIETSFFKAAAMSNRDEGHTCPLCMKYFPDANLGTAHSKNCAAKNHVSTKQLLNAVALQKRQADERLAIGLPAGPFVQPKNKTPKRPRETVSHVDSELELALALSKSLQENEMKQELEEALLLAADERGFEPTIEMTSSQRKRTLKNFGFSTDKPSAPGISEGPLKSRRRKRMGPTVLQTRTQESRDRLLSDRIAEVLMGNEAITQLTQGPNSEKVEKPGSLLKSRRLKEIHRTSQRLWDSACLSSEVTNFYVANLSPMIMPGQDVQPGTFSDATKPKVKNCLSTKSPSKDDQKISPRSSLSLSSDTRSTLMEKVPNIETRNAHVTDREYRNTLPADWSGILNVSSMSDLVIIVKSNHVWVHKLVLHVRCCDILLDIEPNDDPKYAHVKERVHWPEVDFLVATAFLEFVYSGIIEKNDHIFEDNRSLAEVRSLARKYRLKILFDYLRKRKLEIGIRRDVESRRSGLNPPIIVDVSEITSKVDSNENVTKNEEKRKVRDKIEDIQSRDCAERNRLEIDKIEDIHDRVYTVQQNPCNVDQIKEIDFPDIENQDNRYKTDKSMEILVSNDTNIENRLETNKVEDIQFTSDTIVEKRLKPTKIEENRFSDDSIQENRFSTNIEVSSLPELTTRENRSEVPKFEEITEDPKMAEVSIEESSVSGNVVHGIDKGETGVTDVVSVSSEASTSPDLFDETMRRSSRLESSPEVSQDSIGHNSNLKFLAELIENDDSSQESSLGSASTLEMKMDNSSEKIEEPEVSTPTKRTDEILCERSDRETPRSRNEQNTNYSCVQPKAKSNLSLFIEKVHKINSKSAMDSCTDEESVGGTIDRRRFRNPFNLDNPSNPNTPKTGNPEKEFEKNEHFQDSTISTINDTFCTDDENVSMYSKYKKANSHNNSITTYRDLLKKFYTKAGDTSENEIYNVAIDLTQESDEEQPASSSSSVHPPKKQESINRILDTDSSNSSLPNDQLLQRLDNPDQINNLSVIEDPLKKSFVRDQNPANLTEIDETLDKVTETTDYPLNSLVLSDLDVFEIDEEILLPQPVTASNADDDPPSKPGSSKIFGTVESSRKTKRPGSSSEYPDNEVFVINDDPLTQSSNSSAKTTLSPDKVEDCQNSTETSGSSVPCRRKRLGSSPEYSYTNSQSLANSSQPNEILTQSLVNLDNSPENHQEKNLEPINSTRSSRSNFGFSYEFPEIDFYENHHEIFTQSFETPKVPCRPTSPVVHTEKTPESRSAILLSSSPEFDDFDDFGGFSIRNERDANKENSVERGLSPLYHEELAAQKSSPRAETSSREFSSRTDRHSSHAVKKLMARSISMPESTLTNENSRRRTRTPRKSARPEMSRELTPPRNYDAMDTPELKRELAKYGIKPQKRKRARQLLNHIYNELHRDNATPRGNSRESSPMETEEERGAPPRKKIGKIGDRNSNDSESDGGDFALSQASPASQELIIPEEMEFPDADVSPKAGPAKIKDAFVELLKVDKKLHTKILTYEPLPFEVLHSSLKALGLKCKQNELMDFLDDECITFQMVTQSSKSRTKKTKGRNGAKRKDNKDAKEAKKISG